MLPGNGYYGISRKGRTFPRKEPSAFSQYKRLRTLRVSTQGTILFENCSNRSSKRGLRERGQLTFPICGSYRELHYGCSTTPLSVFGGFASPSMFYLQIYTFLSRAEGIRIPDLRRAKAV